MENTLGNGELVELKKSECCGEAVVSSGIPFDGTNKEYALMCAKCGGVPY